MISPNQINSLFVRCVDVALSDLGVSEKKAWSASVTWLPEAASFVFVVEVKIQQRCVRFVVEKGAVNIERFPDLIPQIARQLIENCRQLVET